MMMAVPYPTGWTPQGMTNLLWWLDAARGVTKDGSDAVSQWDDLSGNGFHVAQGTPANQPVWLSSGINSKPAIEFTDEKLEGNFAHTGGSAALFAVGTLINGGDNGGRMIAFSATSFNDTQAGGWQALKQFGPDEAIGGVYNGSAYPSTAVSYTVPFLFTSMVDGTDIFAGLNGGTLQTSAIAGTNDFDNMTVGANSIADGSAGNLSMHGRLSEVVMISAKPVTRIQQLVEGYLAWKWGIALASGHPWRTRAP